MAHQTFVNIRFKKNATTEFHLFIKKGDSGLLEFFLSTNPALNGYFRYGDLKKQFCKRFGIALEKFENYYAQKLEIDLSEFFQSSSNTVAEVYVDEPFFEKSREQTNEFVWISKGDLDKNFTIFSPDHAQVLQALLQEFALENLPADLRQSIYVLQQAHEQGKLVVFAGAGISRDSGLPLWGEIKLEMLDLFDSDLDPNSDPTLVAQYLYNARGSKEYKDRLLELLGYSKNPQPNEIHRAIAKLRPQHIITTNFDDLLEKALPIPAPYFIVREDGDFPRSNLSKFLVKMHGDWERLNFVFREDDYLKYSRERPLTENFVKSIFASHIVLFVGFSFDDRNLKQILDWVKDILGKDFQPAYLFSVKPMNEHEKTYFKNRGVHLIGWADGYSRILIRIGNGTPQMPSGIGAKTADFINFLSEKNYHKYERLRKAKSQSILEQLYDALYMFRAFNSLPPYAFERLFPFSPFRLSISKVQEDADTGLRFLETGNASVVQLMQSIEFEGNKILIKDDGILRNEILSVQDYERKLWYVFEKLISSNIFCIHRKDDDEIRHYRIDLDSQFSEKLLFHKWSGLQFNELLETIQKREYAFGKPDMVPNPLRDGLLDGFVLSQMCFYAEAYEVFQKLEFEARRAEDYALLFLCQLNRKKVGLLLHIRSRFGDYSSEYGEVIKKEVDSIDLNELLRSIQIESEVQKLLDEIKTGKIILNFSIEIEKRFAEILKVYKIYKNESGFYLGANHPSYLGWEFENLCWFFDSNGLIADDDRAFRSAAEKTFEALIASYQTANRYENRYSGFHGNILLLCLRWLKPETLKSILNHYEIKEIQFVEGQKKSFIEYALNFFKSGFQENTMIGGVFENKLYQNYLHRNSIYEGFLDKLLGPNLLIILSLTDLSDLSPGLAAQLCDAVLKSRQFNTKRFSDSDMFLSFSCKHIQFYNKSQIQTILNLVASDYVVNPSRFSQLIEELRVFHPDFRISYSGFWESYLTEGEGGTSKIDHLSTLAHFHEFLELEQIETIQKLIVNQLRTRLDLDVVILYLEAMTVKVVPQQDLPVDLLKFIKSQFENIKKIQFKPDGELEPISYNQLGIPIVPFQEYWLARNLVKLNFNQGLNKETLNWLLNQSDLPLALRWLLDPMNFDYSKFDHFWLFFIFYEKSIYEKLQELKIKKLNAAIHLGLKNKYSEKLCEIFFEYF